MKAFLGGFVNGLGFNDIRALLESAFGKPGEQGRSAIEQFKSFGVGLGQGLKSIFDSVKGLMLAFTGGQSDPEVIGRLTGKIIGLSGALLLMAPVVGVLGAIGTAIGAFASVVAGAAGVLRAAGLMSGSAAAGGAATGAVGRGVLGALGKLAVPFAMPLTMDPSKADTDRMMRKLGGWALEQERNRRALDKNTDAILQRQSYEEGTFRNLIHRTSLDGDVTAAVRRAVSSGDVARAAGFGQASSALGGGIPYTPGAGGSALYGSTPGGKLPDIGVGSRYGVGPSVPGVGGSNQGGTRSWRNNNPGNLKYGKFAAGMGATGRDDKGFAVFPSYEAGRKAQEQLLFGSDAYRNLSIADAIRKYAPGSDGNDPAGYAAQMARAAGVGVGTRLSDLTPDQRRKFLDAQQAKEGWKVGSSGGVSSGLTGSLTTDGPIRANLMHGQYGAPGQNLGRLTTGNGKSALVNNAALPSFDGFVKELEAQGYNVQSLGGFNNRMIRGGSKLSQHAYGNAIDLNPGKNPLGTTMTDMPDNVRALAKKYGLIWGMDWKGRKDPMHFEWNGTRPWLEGKALADKAGTMLGKGTLTPSQDIGDGMKSTGWSKVSPADLAKESQAEKLAREAPARSGGVGRGQSSVHAPINVSGSGNPEEVANHVQRKIQDLQNYRTHDIGFQNI